MSTLRIPLIKEVPDQTVDVVLEGKPYVLRVLWNVAYEYFSLSILRADNTVLLENVKMVEGYPLIAKFKDVELPPGEFYFLRTIGKPVRPGFEDLEATHSLFYDEAA